MTDISNKYRDEFLKEQLKVAKKYKRLMAMSGDEIARLVRDPNSKLFKEFDFSKYPRLQRKIAAIIATFHVKALRLTEDEIRKAWRLSNGKNDALLDDYLRGLVDVAAMKGSGVLYVANRDIMEAFISRTRGAETLSASVWKISNQLRKELELQLGLGIMNGDSADTISRRIRRYLDNPEALYRRVRNKYGDLIPSKAMSEYHPGQGTYRSAYKNAVRVARTETNQAYLLSDHYRWESNPLVEGVKIELSSQHPEYKFVEICEELEGEYPTGFVFSGWHPQCLCHATPLLANREDFRAWLRGEEKLTTNPIKATPPNFREWIANNIDRLSEYKSVPYYILDNQAIIKDILHR